MTGDTTTLLGWSMAVRAVAVVLALSAPASVADTVTTVSGESFEGAVTGWSAGADGALVAVTADGERRVAASDLERVAVESAAPLLEAATRDGVVESAWLDLEAGPHRVVVAYVQGDQDMRLTLDWQREGAGWSDVQPAVWSHRPAGGGAVQPGVRAVVTAMDGDAAVGGGMLRDVLAWPRLADVVVPAPRAGLSAADRAEHFGVVFDGWVTVAEAGRYRFRLSADDRALMFLGAVPGRYDLGVPAAGPGEAAHGSAAVEMVGGDGLAGALVGWDDAGVAVRVHGVSAEAVRVPADYVRWVVLDSAAAADAGLDGAALARDVADPGLDVLYAPGRDGSVQRVPGRALGLAAAEGDGAGPRLAFEFGGERRTLPLSRVVAVRFAVEDLVPVTRRSAFRVASGASGAGTGSSPLRLTGSVSRVAEGGGGEGEPGGAWVLTTAWGDAVTLVDGFVAEAVNGRRLAWTPRVVTDAEHVPYFDRALPPMFVAEGPVRLSDGTELPAGQGWVMHSRSTLTADATGAARFSAEAAMVDPAGRLGDVSIRVLADDAVVYERASLVFADGRVAIDAALPAGAQRVTVEVGFGAGQDVGDRVALIRPALLRGSE